jgi:hypothetical protein
VGSNPAISVIRHKKIRANAVPPSPLKLFQRKNFKELALRVPGTGGASGSPLRHRTVLFWVNEGKSASQRTRNFFSRCAWSERNSLRHLLKSNRVATLELDRNFVHFNADVSTTSLNAASRARLSPENQLKLFPFLQLYVSCSINTRFLTPKIFKFFAVFLQPERISLSLPTLSLKLMKAQKSKIKRFEPARIFNSSSWISLSPWYDNFLIKFLQFQSCSKIMLNISTSLHLALSTKDRALCSLWAQKSTHFQKTIGNGFFLLEAFHILFLSFKHKNIKLLSTWLTKIFHKINFWRFRFVFSFLRYILLFHFWPRFAMLGVRGLRVKLKGKISVSGNARTRRLVCFAGSTSFSNLSNKIHYSCSLVRTFTGVQGLQIWLFH